MFEKWFPNVDIADLNTAIYETFYMTILSLIGTFIIGIILGLLLYLTSKGKLWENKVVYGIVAAVVNIFRAIPFIILILLLFPFTDFIVGTIRGPEAALPALIIGSAPFYARLVEIALKEVDNGVVEAAKAMGAKNSTIMFKVLLKESMPALVSGLTVTAIALIGSTAVAGVIGAGGLGDFAYFYGFQRRQFDVVFICTLLIVIVVFVFQFIGDLISNKLDKR
ncbi:methionine ABC transporter permease [Terribacillus saccharophilus]|uniref:Methionine ABC transporter permease n=1 Tax=Terribacillus saccharophilus TaxID=361277 RepID=A0A075LQD9_9BACI|nr:MULTISPECIES: methionine ABC transporter permease [Terribacillus]AIF68197.1 methionine ABC transporter permease [Terribacillus goriensis]MCM3226354.1 ABC transporter permease [Terribacillus saccharophilus]